jgi:hypothetical protein
MLESEPCQAVLEDDPREKAEFNPRPFAPHHGLPYHVVRSQAMSEGEAYRRRQRLDHPKAQ